MAVDFPGTDEYLNCGSGATLDNIWAAGGTVAFWYNPDTLPGDGASRHITGKCVNADGWVMGIYNPAGASLTLLVMTAWFSGTDGQWSAPSNSLGTAGIWYHIAVTYTSTAGQKPTYYINGVSVSVTQDVGDTTGTFTDAAYNLYIGGSAYPAYEDGKIEDYRAYKRILTADEVAILASGYRGPLGGEVLWLPMDGARATEVFDGATLAVNTNYLNDLSGNGNHGNPTGSPLGYASDCRRCGPGQPLVAHMGPQTTAYRMRHWRRQRDMSDSVSEQIT